MQIYHDTWWSWFLTFMTCPYSIFFRVTIFLQALVSCPSGPSSWQSPPTGTRPRLVHWPPPLPETNPPHDDRCRAPPDRDSKLPARAPNAPGLAGWDEQKAVHLQVNYIPKMKHPIYTLLYIYIYMDKLYLDRGRMGYIWRCSCSNSNNNMVHVWFMMIFFFWVCAWLCSWFMMVYDLLGGSSHGS